MIKLDTPLGEFYVRASEIVAIAPERNRPGCSMIYTSLFPDGLSVDMTAGQIIDLIWSEEGEYEVEFEPEEEIPDEPETGEEKTHH